ncbi:HAD family hydrolase [Corynebacterium sputi]|uniref:HAD family hydrolase n=1 Tax=Corynebacterium sputi TaxID=489915 RepID=UPI0009FD10C6|nr:HAD family phosphatase [Corynebacterium sputi]
MYLLGKVDFADWQRQGSHCTASLARFKAATVPYVIPAILWDMDGTLIDTELLWGEAVFTMSEAMGRRASLEVRESTMGTNGPFTVRACADYAGLELTDEEERQWVKRLFEMFLEKLSNGADLCAGIPEILAEGREQGIPMIIATNTVRVIADKTIDIIGRDWFIDTVCGDEVPSGKPAPDIYLEAARRTGVAPEDCLAVEDSFTGSSAAVAAGCRTLGAPIEDNGEIADGAHRLSQLIPGRTDFSGMTLADLEELYQRIGTPN